MIFLILFAVIVVGYFALKIICETPAKQENQTETASDEPEAQIGKIQRLQFFCVKDKGYHVSVWPKDRYEYDIVHFYIAGITHYKHTAMKHLGETMGFLAAEPDNPYDENAIKIVTPQWETVGYVPRDMTAEVRKHTNLPCPCPFYIGYYNDREDIHFYTDAYIDLNYTNK